MADIQSLLRQLLSAVYGKDVRQAIHDAIHQCYADGKAGAVDLTAREQINTLSASKAEKTVVNELLADVEELKANGTTAEVIQAYVEEKITTWLDDGTIAGMTIPEKGVEEKHLSDDLLSELKQSGVIMDSNGNKYSMYVNSDGTICIKRVYEAFADKEWAMSVDMSTITQDENSEYHFYDAINEEDVHVCQKKFSLSKSFTNTTTLEFNKTLALQKMIESESGAYSFIAVSVDNDTYNLFGQKQANIIGEAIRNTNSNNNANLAIEVACGSGGFTYENTSGEIVEIIFSETLDMTGNEVKADRPWLYSIIAWVLEVDGSICVYAYDKLIYKHPAPDDFKRWDFAVATANWAAWSANITCIKQYIKTGIILNNSINGKDIENYYMFLKSDLDVSEINTVDAVYMQIGDSYTVKADLEPTVIEETIFFTSSDETVATVSDSGEIKAVSDGDAIITLTAGTFSLEVPVHIGQQVSDEAIATIEALSTKVVNQIVLVNEEDIPSKMTVGDEFAIYALAIDTTADVPYSVSEQNMVNFTSSDSSVCSVGFGVLHANKAGTAIITASSMDGTATTTFNVTVVDEHTTKVPECDIYHCNDRQFGIYNNGTNAESTTKGIQSALNYASEQGYKMIKFNEGDYLIDPESCPIVIPSGIKIDFNNSIIRPVKDNTHVTASKAYVIFSLVDVEDVEFANAKVYADNYYGGTYHLEQERSFDIIGGKNITVKNCEFSYSAGFNFCLAYSIATVDGKDTRRAFKLTNVEQGGITDTGENDATDTSTSHFRSIDFISLGNMKNNFGLGNMQGYQGYLYMSSRLYNIYFYDADKNFISCQKWCVQYQTYYLPENAVYAKIMFFQASAPTSAEADFGGIAHLYSARNPQNVKIQNCIFKENVSTAISPQGGKNVLIENCYFENNGSIDPSSTIDWEDGRIHIQGHIVKHNEFKTNAKKWNGMLNIINGRDVVIHDNEIDVPFYNKSETQNSRIYRNVFKYQTANKFSLASKGDMIFAGNLYPVEPAISAPVGGNIMMVDNKIIT